jgi:hypothetical protein
VVVANETVQVALEPATAVEAAKLTLLTELA